MKQAVPTRDTIFCEAIEIADAAERAAYLAGVTGDDAELRRRVEALVTAHFHAGDFLEPQLATAAFAPDPEQIGTMIGPYKLLEQIGEGGMGIVYVAEQTEPVRRRVALKVIKPGMDSREVVARFEAERQALAMMDHPNIAKVLDGGLVISGQSSVVSRSGAMALTTDHFPLTTAQRPYFVMELVRGLPITDYCDQARLSAERRLRLFVQVCRAVQHAHQKGIIHRDLKPSNVLVTMHDGEPVPKVIDFGVAKALNQRLTDKSVYTRFTQMIGTPLYMSPEQAELSALDVDTRSDVYSLGVLLYELLTGTTPFDAQKFREANFDEMRRIIREDEPPRPSARISTLDAAARSTVSSKRGLDDRQLSRLLHGDLDWIVMKALEKDRNRRYESAGAFAADVERYLTDQPVEARPPSVGYRLWKFVRRNRTALATTALLIAALLVTSGAIAWTAFSRSADRRLAGQRAGEFLAEADRFEKDGRWPEAFGMVDRAEAALGQSGGSLELHDQVRERKRQLAFVLRLDEIRLERTAAVRDGAFDNQLANELYTDAFAKFGINIDELASEEAARRMAIEPIRGEMVIALDDWMRLRRKREADWKRVLSVAQFADPDPIRSEIRNAWAESDTAKLKRLAAETDIVNLHPNTVELLQQHLNVNDAIPLLQKAQRQRPGDFWLNTQLGHRLLEINPPQIDKAIAYFRSAVASRSTSPGALYNLARNVARIREYDEAIELCRAAIRQKPDYADVYHILGFSLKQKGAFDEAIVAFREAIRLKPDSATDLSNLGSALYSQKRYAEAIIPLREAVRVKPDFAGAHTNLGVVLRQTGEVDEAITAFRTAIRLDPNQALAHNGLGGILCDKKQDYDGAIAAFRQALELEPDNSMIRFNLGKALTRKGELDAAEKEFREAIRMGWDHPNAHVNLGELLLKKQSWDGAISVAKDLQRRYPQEVAGYALLANASAVKGDHGTAVSTYRQALQLRPEDPEVLRVFTGYQIKNNDLDGALKTLAELLRLQPLDFRWPHQACILYMKKGAWADAATAARKAIQLKPDLVAARFDLGQALKNLGRLEEAVAEFREATRIEPGNEQLLYVLGSGLFQLRRWEESAAEFRESAKLKPEAFGAHYHLGLALHKAGQMDEAIEAYKSAIHHKPDYAEAFCNLGDIFRQKEQFAESLESYRQGHEFGSKNPKWAHPSEQWLADARRLVALEPRLAGILSGADVPTDPADAALAAFVAKCRKHNVRSAELYRTAFANAPALAENLGLEKRFWAACCAAQAGCGLGKDADGLNADRQVAWLRQALVWLRADFAVCQKRLAGGTSVSRRQVLAKLQDWQMDPDLACVRDSDSLAKLPENERAEWSKFWADLQAEVDRFPKP